MERLTLYTDGGSHGNPGEGAWAFYLVDDATDAPTYKSGYEHHTTNNRMELEAVIAGLHEVAELGGRTVEVRTDSEYVRKGITEWIHRWKKNGWRTAARKPVKNEDLWRKLDEISARLDTQWLWVKGHAGDTYNELCDALVQDTIAARSQS